MKKRILSIFLSLIFMFSLVSSVYADKPDVMPEVDSEIEQFINDYFSFRQDSFDIASKKISQSVKMMDLLESIESNEVFKDEEKRQEKLDKMASKLGIRLEEARTTARIEGYETNGDETIVDVYEWTFFDYTGEKGLLDTSGYGVRHQMIFETKGNKIKLIADNYDEGPLTEMRSSSYETKEDIEENLDVFEDEQEKGLAEPLSEEEKKKLKESESDAVNALEEAELELASYEGYDVQGAVDYADTWVYQGAEGDIFDDYYNDEYWNCNNEGAPSNGGGDCANYVSQSLNVGGNLPMEGEYSDASSTSVWWYNNKGTSDTSDDSISNTWAGAHGNRTYMLNNYGTAKNSPTNLDIIKGNPVYYDWHYSSGTPTYNHVTICVGTDSNGKPVVNSHNNDYYHVIWNYGYADTYYSTVKIMEDDHGNALDSSATRIYADSPEDGYIDYADDADCFRFTPTETGEYTIETTGDSDTLGYLYNSSKSLLDSDDDNGEGTNFQINYSLNANSTYYIKVKNYSEYAMGPYTLNITSGSSSNDDHSDYLDSSATRLYAGSSVSGVINSPGDEDCFRFIPTSTRTYTIETSGSIDTYGYLYNSSGTELEYDDDGGVDTNFMIYWTLNANSTYYIKVRHYSDSGTGSYSITVE